MKIGVISDAHGNIYGLKKCVESLEKIHVQKIYFLGDAVNYFAKSKEVLDYLKHKRILCIKGNHEMLLLENRRLSRRARQIYNIDYTRSILKNEDYAFLKTWEDHIVLKFKGLKIFLVHGSPFHYFDDYVGPDSDLSRFSNINYDMILMGHTHIPFIKNWGCRCIINVGSVGFSRDDGRFISFALIDVKERKVKILRKAFPFKKLDHLQPFHQNLKDVLDRRWDAKKVKKNR